MTFQEFLEKYNGKYIDFDGTYGPQCMDLLHQYVVEVLGLTDPRILAAPAAKDLYNNFDNIFGKEYFERIPNTPDGVPQEGDIVLWGYNPYGHVAIFVEGNVNSFRSFDQNYPVGSPCHIQNHNYNNVLGWLRFNQTVKVTLDSKTFENLVRKGTIYDQILQKLNITDNQDIVLAEIEKFLKYEDALYEKQKQIDTDKGTIEKLQSQLQDLQNNLNQLKEDNQNLQNQVEELKKQNQELENEIAKQAATIQLNISEINDLTSKLNSLKEQLKQKPLSGFKAFLYRIIQRYRR
jgi:hypothetical protein